ncbi:MAG: ribokinase [Solirubrobacteraceae bacterium]|jgi:ribokinase|nr:ribokinase [Solirubrobacteraceae bacterium]
MRVAVVGHVEWIEFARLPRLPGRGEIADATEWWEEAAGGAAIAAVQALRLGAEVDFFTAVGDDDRGRRALARFKELGLQVHAVSRGEQRRGWVVLDAGGERTITILGARTVPAGADPLPWDRLRDADAVYFTGGDADALRAARAGRRLVATPRAGEALRAGVALDVLVRSRLDPGECHAGEDLDPAPRRIVSTAGGEGGSWTGADDTSGRWHTLDPPGPRRDAYGAGDSFAGALTWALGDGRTLDDALQVAARAGAAKLTGRAGYDGQLTADQL